MRSNRTAICIAFLTTVTILHSAANSVSAGLTAPTQDQLIGEWKPINVLGTFPGATFVNIVMLWDEPLSGNYGTVLRNDRIFCDGNRSFSAQIIPFRDPNAPQGANCIVHVFADEEFEEFIGGFWAQVILE